ncbi:scavenger receptor cysteine-rich type 1 protein M130-like isoform X2 [Oryzias melastigma]|uniref:scavenger receptor cysteine-rich type 1 protein M130-like isoform X2 n=1 Tax=Oryzias melastigma TaxID=30732 RepID=UPI00168D34BF|nr:scavenger receptor cysteine-rich type 1 protein M130-like isoform X2 [Oryzias melastigma]
MNTVDVVRVLMLLHVSGFSSGLCAELHSGSEEFRLVGGASRCTGRLERKVLEEWEEEVEDNNNLKWNLERVDHVCKSLNCGSVVSMRRAIAFDFYKINLEIICSDSIRLVNHLCSGRLEVMLNGSWSSVNEDDFDQQDAEVVCRELGCGPPSGLQGALYGETEAPEWSREFLCEGHESALLDCKSSSSSQKFCSSGKAVELTCSGRLRLVGTTSRCAGVLEMLNHREWRPVYDMYSHWDHEAATAVCSRLGCGFAVFQDITNNSTQRNVWRISFSCLKSLSNACFYTDGNRKTDSGLEVSCSDSLESPNISVSSSSGVSKARNQGLQVFFGTSFSIICSSHHLYQGGIFQLIFNNSTTTLNNTLPAVNNSALFSFLEASHAHQGDYICVHHVHINSQNLTLQSQQLSLTVLVSVSLTEFIIRHVVVLLIMVVSTSALYVYFKTKSRRMQEPKRNRPVDDGPALRPRERRRLQEN